MSLSKDGKFHLYLNDAQVAHSAPVKTKTLVCSFLQTFEAQFAHTLEALRHMAHRLRTEAHWIDTALAEREVA